MKRQATQQDIQLCNRETASNLTGKKKSEEKSVKGP